MCARTLSHMEPQAENDIVIKDLDTGRQYVWNSTSSREQVETAGPTREDVAGEPLSMVDFDRKLGINTESPVRPALFIALWIEARGSGTGLWLRLFLFVVLLMSLELTGGNCCVGRHWRGSLMRECGHAVV